jgi:hypothetical protein
VKICRERYCQAMHRVLPTHIGEYICTIHILIFTIICIIFTTINACNANRRSPNRTLISTIRPDFGYAG